VEETAGVVPFSLAEAGAVPDDTPLGERVTAIARALESGHYLFRLRMRSRESKKSPCVVFVCLVPYDGACGHNFSVVRSAQDVCLPVLLDRDLRAAFRAEVRSGAALPWVVPGFFRELRFWNEKELLEVIRSFGVGGEGRCASASPFMFRPDMMVVLIILKAMLDGGPSTVVEGRGEVGLDMPM